MVNLKQNPFLSKLFTSFNIIGMMVNTIFVTVHLSDLILGKHLPIFACYINTLAHEFMKLYGAFINFEIFFIKYWVEFIWKSVRQVDDNFIMVFLTVSNLSFAIIFSHSMLVSGDEHISSKLLMNEFDWTTLFYQRRETPNLQ